MIDITQAQANQTTRSGVNEDWIVTLDGKNIYSLPSHFSVQETFLVRDVAEKMMKMAVIDAVKLENETNEMKMQKIIINGDAKLDALKRENMRLSEALEQQQLGEVA